MSRLDHLQLPVRDWRASRDWWRDNLGFAVEMEMPNTKTAGLKDEGDLTVFLVEGLPLPANPNFSITVQVKDVETLHSELTRNGVSFSHPPLKVFWGYGAELFDPNGYRLWLWDPVSMKEKG